MMQYRTERKRSAAEASESAGELANGSKAHIRRAGGRIGDGRRYEVLCSYPRRPLSFRRQAVAIEEPTTRWQRDERSRMVA
jgi:hypothetical protein